MQTTKTETFVSKRTVSKTNILTKTAILSAIAYIVMLLEFPVPFAPAFLKMDFSDIPALVASFAINPVVGVLVELVKNIIKFMMGTRTGGVGELGNFLVGASFVYTAGVLYHMKKTKTQAIVACLVATVVMTAVAGLFNNFVLIPFYAKVMPLDAIIQMGSAINPNIVDIKTLVLYGITPFNIFKGVSIAIVTMLIYKKIKPLLSK